MTTSTDLPKFVYHMAHRSDWERVPADGDYPGSPDDRRDGFIHFSTATQVERSARKHRAGQTDLLLVAVETERLGPELRWETNRSGEAFPHLYRGLRPREIAWVRPLPLGADGLHQFPPLDE